MRSSTSLASSSSARGVNTRTSGTVSRRFSTIVLCDSGNAIVVPGDQRRVVIKQTRSALGGRYHGEVAVTLT